MTHALLLLASVITQASPVLPAGSSSEFSRACLAVEEALARGDVAAARAVAGTLPKRTVRVEWDEGSIPASRRVEFAEARDRIFELWRRGITGVTISLGKPADVRIRFVKNLPPVAGAPHPAGAVHFFSPDPAEPRLEAVVALERGEPFRPSESVDVQNEVGYAIGAYFGLARNPLQIGPVMGRSDLPAHRFLAPSIEEYRIARINLEAAEALRRSTLKGERLQPARPQIFVDAPTLPTEPVLQGEPILFKIQVTNRGDSPLQLQVRPDCGCLTTTGWANLDAGETTLLQAAFDTREFVGKLHKRLVFYSNDPDFPVKEMPIDVTVTPRYRLIAPGGPVVIADERGGSFELYLALSSQADLKPTGVRLNGVPGSVEMKPWTGPLADPEMGEPERERSGYRFVVKLQDQLPPGRGNGTVIIDTDSKLFPTLYHSFSAQKGIVAMPDELYLGEIPQAPRRASFLLSRPGMGFKVLRVTSDSPFVKGEARAVRESWEHLITVQFDGKAPSGNFTAALTVETDDPKQPKILVSFRAVVR